MAGLLTLAMVVGSFAGCGSSSSKETAAGESAAATTAESTADTASAETAGKKLKVALILPGKKDDVSFNQAMYEGMKKYADANPDKIDLNVTENVYEVADIEPALMVSLIRVMTLSLVMASSSWSQSSKLALSIRIPISCLVQVTNHWITQLSMM